MTARVWILNFDAEQELQSGVRQTPSREDALRLDALAEAVRGGLVPTGDAVIAMGAKVARGAHRGAVGRAWCPTRWALERLAHAGAAVCDAPPMELIARVNHRRWAAALGTHLPDAGFATTLDAVDQRLARPWPVGGWLLKRALGFAGRGRVHLRTARDREDPRFAAWVDRALRDGGVMVEPHVERLEDLGLHGFLARDGALDRGVVTRQRCDARGQWVASERIDEGALDPSHRRALAEVFDETAAALGAAGYFGPFNVDAFVWRDGGGVHLQPRSEVNARYSMGWSVGMGATRPDLTHDV